ncbi:hypothetical protein AVEN_173492-1 [Araneus ventricosus]|uniref:Uncharacterized protein n=1 Tax=Araneus ventricosus TaxID=182803 RepID=A0A4Y2KL74_ARAVE|nr:hypothetical protein AVEN_173492-1 [Araneus ventricosus]
MLCHGRVTQFWFSKSLVTVILPGRDNSDMRMRSRWIRKRGHNKGSDSSCFHSNDVTYLLMPFLTACGLAKLRVARGLHLRTVVGGIRTDVSFLRRVALEISQQRSSERMQ